MADPIIKKATPPAQPPAEPPAKPPLTDAEKTIQEIENIKKNMVAKSEYDKAIADRDKFKDALLNGATEKDDAPAQSAAELRKKYAADVKAGVTNVEGFDTVLKLRDAVIEETGRDPFMTEALHKIDPDFGERVAENIGEILEKSEGNPEMFNALLSQNVK